MKKLLILIVIVALGVSAYYMLSNGEVEPTDVREDVVDDELLDEEVEVADFEDLEVEEVTPEEEAEFAAIESELDKFDAMFADETKTIDNCAELTNSEIKEMCEQSFTYRTAVNAGDKELCMALLYEEDQESCKADIDAQ